MSIEAMLWAWAQPVSPIHKLVLLALADGARTDNQITPGVAAIAERCSLTEDTAREAVRALEEAGYIQSGGMLAVGLR